MATYDQKRIEMKTADMLMNIECIDHIQKTQAGNKHAYGFVQGLKDMLFKNWHQIVLSDNCQANDLDLVESRQERIVALDEIKEYDRRLDNSLQRKIYLDIAKKLVVPPLFIRYNLDIPNMQRKVPNIFTGFEVGDFSKDVYGTVMSPEELIRYMEELGTS